MNTSIRKTTVVDIPKVMPLVEELNLSDFPYDGQVNVKWGETKKGKKYYQKKIDCSKGVCFIAEVENEPIGFVLGGIDNFGYRTIKVAELDNLYVKEKFRSLGVGKKLVEVFKNWAKEKGAQKVGLNTFNLNKRAIHFYEEEGFEPYSTRYELPL